jgi:acyl dehydratase
MEKKTIRVGDRASIENTFTDQAVRQFAEVSQDSNSLHLDETAAEQSIFGRRVVHGMLVASLFSGLLGVHLPGEGTIYLGQTLSFKAPVFIGDQITATVEVTEIRAEKSIAKLRTYCVNQQGVTVVDGEATVIYA